MKKNMKTLAVLAALLLCATLQAQDLKPVKDKQTKKYGYQDKQKNWVIDPSFDDAKKFDDDGCAQVKVDGKYGLIDLQGRWVLPAEYDDIGKFDKNGLCELRIKEGKTKLYGVADRSGNVVLPLVFRNVDLPKKGGCILASSDVGLPGLVGTPLWGVYSPDGKEVIGPRFLYSPSVYDDKLVAQDVGTGLEGVVGMDGQEILPFDFLKISHFSNTFRTLDRCFTQATYTDEGRKAETFIQPGAIIPYDPGMDRVRAAAWNNGCIGSRLHANQAMGIDLRPESYGTRSGVCRDLGNDWGLTGKRFVRLEPILTETVDEYAMQDPLTGNYYTLAARLYEANGEMVAQVADKGYLIAECTEGVLYNAGGIDTWFIFNDPNALSAPARSIQLTGYRALQHDNVCNGLGISSYNLERLVDARTFINRCKEITNGENVGVTSYILPVLNSRDARMQRDVMRQPLFHRMFTMEEVVNCDVRRTGADLEVELHHRLVCPFEDRFSDPYYTMNGAEEIWWGPHNARTVQLSLRPTTNREALADDVAGTGVFWDIVLSLYEEDGTWLRTLAVVPYADYAEDGVVVFEPLGIALVTRNTIHRRPGGREIVHMRAPMPLPHTISALEQFNFRERRPRP